MTARRNWSFPSFSVVTSTKLSKNVYDTSYRIFLRSYFPWIDLRAVKIMYQFISTVSIDILCCCGVINSNNLFYALRFVCFHICFPTMRTRCLRRMSERNHRRRFSDQTLRSFYVPIKRGNRRYTRVTEGDTEFSNFRPTRTLFTTDGAVSNGCLCVRPWITELIWTGAFLPSGKTSG